MTTPLYYKYWGKASKKDDSYHLLPYHCLDVAAVASTWWQHSSSIRNSFIKSTGLTEEQSRALVLFFIALHDFGKLDMRFQMKAPHLSPYEDNNLKVNCKKYYHGEQGYYWYFREATEYGLPVIEEYGEIDTINGELWMSATAGHHGEIPNNIGEDSLTFPNTLALSQDHRVRKQWLQALQKLFLEPVNQNLIDIPEGEAPILLAGFCSVCDWLGSNQNYFIFNSDSDISLPKYFDSQQNKAQQILKDFGLLSTVKTKGGMAELYSFPPHNIQTRIDDLAVEQSLVIIEASTGSGKTEAALAFASKLLAIKLADSITFALPSQATANAMFERLECVAEKIFQDKNNIILAPGKSQSNPHFQSLIKLSENFNSAQGHEEAGVQCSEWLSSSRKRAFLGQIAVTTVDQVMLSAIKSLQHYFVRLFGVGKSVLIIDEIHAYDAYMYAILKVVIAQQKQAGGSVILLSATLPDHQKQALINAWDVSATITETAYPLMLQATENKVTAFTTDAPQDAHARAVITELISNDDFKLDDSFLQRIVDAAEIGAKVGIVCNLVDDAQQYAKILAHMTNMPVDLFHSRYRYCDRMLKEQKVLNHYDIKSPRQGRILVGTQVIEQSLDIDFDWLISFICPIDLLFQRMGRLHRHNNSRPAGFEKPLCSIVVPETIDLTDEKTSKETYDLHGFIYKNIRALWRTQQYLIKHSKIEFPQAYRDWIEPIYQQAPWKNEPEVITALANKYEEDQFASTCVAKGFTKAKSFFHDTEGNAALLTREGELNLSVIPMVEKQGKKYFLDETTKIPKPDDKYNRETLSQNSLAVPCTATWKNLLPACKEGIYFLAMQKTELGWEYQHQKGRLIYTQERGLEKIEENIQK
ncbi:MAG: CRISPR-associated helicase/endonuclease Cas3 [Methylococcaceae bacterium]|nr:CRISPR-associated helicase/endonuclease Cas3 [Methylococcaceae bacterium]